ncbi:MAG: serine/threonine protein kinase [Labilithrix sp.]|nr:serine/threonine protein kinase [Labilithrix sp.]
MSGILLGLVRRALSDDIDLHPGQILGPYELLVPVGSGGMAHVWAARHRGAGVVFALKMLLPHLAENAAFREMFFDEARIASRIHHENVARTFELADLDGLLTLVMEWVDGSSLVRMLRPGLGLEDREDLPRVALPIRHAARIVAETCAGLHAAHELVGENGRPLAVVHRDVSPHNILLTRDGRVKVTDFGVAKAIGKSHMTIAGQVKGKLAYMSPEQLIGGGIDRRSDVFALGSVLYESTTGQRPFQGEHDPQVMAAIVMGNYVPPREVIRGYPKGLEEILVRALANEPNARFPTALDLKRALDGWLATSGPPITGPQISALLQERCGMELNARIGVLSVTLPAALPASASGPHPRVETGGAMEVVRRPLPTPSASPKPGGISAIAAVFAVLIGVVLGLGVLVYVKNARRERRMAAEVAVLDAANANVAEPTSVPVEIDAASAPTPVDEVRPDAAGTIEVLTPAVVTLRVPEGAHLFVNGRELPPGTVTIPRPDAGSVMVLVKAEARENTFVEVKPTSPDEMDVAMAHRARPIRSAAPADPAGSIAMPPNPYE